MKKILLLLLLTVNFVHAHSFKEALTEGKAGDFIVVEQNKSHSLIRIHSNKENLLILEEVSFPSTLLKSIQKNWEEWLSSGAKGHLSWSMTEIDLKNGELYDTFSFTKNAFFTFGDDESFILRLLSAPLRPVAKEKRRKIGPTPREGLDTRKVWNPPLTYQGKDLPSPRFKVFDTQLPKDESPLSGKRIELFYREDDASFPFPYWGQITDASEAALKFRVIDSGRGLPSPKTKLPRRAPHFLKPPKEQNGQILLTASIPRYYKEPHLFAIDQTTFETIQEIPLSIKLTSGEQTEILLTTTSWRQKDRHYTFVLLFESPEEVSIETFPI